MEEISKPKLKKLQKIFELYPQIKLVYFFGSKSQKKSGPLSDYDFAIYADENDNQKLFDLKFQLMDKAGRLLSTDKIDVIILNIVDSPEMKYNVIKEGILIYEIEPYKVLIEPKILNDYFDFRSFLLRFNLTAGK